MTVIKVLFICHGNICRSPMAERVFAYLVRRAGREHAFEIASAATSREELGNPIYPPVARLLRAHGIDAEGHAARQVTAADYAYYDHLVLMDENNRRNLLRLLGGDPDGKVSKLLSGPVATVTWLTRGTPVTSRPPTVTYYRAAPLCWNSYNIVWNVGDDCARTVGKAVAAMSQRTWFNAGTGGYLLRHNGKGVSKL